MGALLSLLRELLCPAPPPARIPAKAKPLTNGPRPAWFPFELYRPIIAYAAERREDRLAPQLARFCLVSRAFRAEAQLLLDEIFTLALELEPVPGPYIYKDHIKCHSLDYDTGVVCVQLTDASFAHLLSLREETKYFALSPRYRRVTFSVTPALSGASFIFCAGPAYEYWFEMSRWPMFLHPRHVYDFGALAQPSLNSLLALHRTGPAWAHHILQDLPANWARNKTRPEDAIGRRMPGFAGRSLHPVETLTLRARPAEGLGDNLAPYYTLQYLHLDFLYRPNSPSMDFLECLDGLKSLTITLRYGATALNTLSTTNYPSIPRPSKRRAPHNIVRRWMALVATLPCKEQVKLTLRLPPLEPLHLRSRDKEFWRRVFADLRGLREWPQILPDTVNEVDTSAFL